MIRLQYAERATRRIHDIERRIMTDPIVKSSDTFYRDFSERQKQLTDLGRARRGRTERARLGLVMRHISPPADMLEIGPGQGSLAMRAVEAGWRYRAMEASPILIEELRGKGLDVIPGWAPPILSADASCDLVYADQVLEHMSGIDAARQFVAEALRVLRPSGVLFVVVPDYLKERSFFWDVDYTHNFVTTERRVQQLLNDGGFEIREVVRSIGAATGVRRDLLAAGGFLTHLPGLDTLSRYTGTADLLFKIRKNLFETLEFVARKPTS
jgi:SAM-dependent methyltransferase